MADQLDVAAVQLNSQDDVLVNLAACRSLVAKAAERGSRLVLLPENFAYFGPDTGKRDVAEPLGETEAPIQRALIEMAREHRLTLFAGGFPERSSDPSRPYNTCAVFGPDGALVASYRKIHLFDVDLADGTRFLESEATKPGTDPLVLEVSGFKVGVSICYDIRFPELYRKLAERGADLIVVPAAFTLHTGKDHWHVLLRARAIESQSWLLAAAQWGKHPRGRTTYGHSLLADPWGTIVAECSDGPGVITARIERGLLDSVRESLPSLKHRRL